VNAEAHIAAGRFAYHGGRLCVARQLYPDVPQPWVDLSTGINPSAYPAPRASARARNRLPEPTELARLESIAAAAFGVSEPSRLVATGGTENALRLLPHVLRLTDAAIAGPTYGSHAQAWVGANATTRVVAESELSATTTRAVALTIVNPNNPDGRVVARGPLLALHDSLQASGGVLIVDEAFADIDPQISVADLAGSERAPRLIVLRSFGKFYGLAGLRLGFVIAAPSIGATLRHLLGDWPVSVDALTAGIAAYADSTWAQRTRESLQRTAQRFDRLLTGSGFEIVGGTTLFRLARAQDAQSRFAHLLSCGVLARPFDHDATLLRFGLPGGRNDWQRLTTALRPYQ
jgi:cobalamin biosynthetic protein CobC